MAISLTRNAIEKIRTNQVNAAILKPILQVTDIKLLSPSNPNRYIVMLSDGVNSHQGMLASNIYYLVQQNKLQNGSIIELSSYVATGFTTGRVVINICELNVKLTTCEQIVAGDPKDDDQSLKIQSGRRGAAKDDRNVQPIYRQLYFNRMTRGRVAKDDDLPRIIPISALSIYSENWAIKARVMKKECLQCYSNLRAEGKLFSFDVVDSDGGEIRVTCFNEVADKIVNVIEEGRFYVISMGSVRPATKNLKYLNNKYMIQLDNTSSVELFSEGKNRSFVEEGMLKTVSQIIDCRLEKQIITVKAQISFITGCDEDDNSHLLSLQITDHTGSTWVMASKEQGEEIIGVSAKDFTNEQGAYEMNPEILRRVAFKPYVFKLKVESGEECVKPMIMEVDMGVVDFSYECKYLLELIDRFKEEAKNTFLNTGVYTFMGNRPNSTCGVGFGLEGTSRYPDWDEGSSSNWPEYTDRKRKRAREADERIYGFR